MRVRHGRPHRLALGGIEARAEQATGKAQGEKYAGREAGSSGKKEGLARER